MGAQYRALASTRDGRRNMDRRMRCLAIAILLLAVALPARAQWKSVELVEIKGAYGLIIVPENWNGSLCIYAHGYSPITG